MLLHDEHTDTSIKLCGLTREPIDLNALIGLINDPAAGGLATFLGVVRNHDHGHPVVSLQYEAHPDAERILREVTEGLAGTPGIRAVALEHRLGDLEIGDIAVGIAVAAEHRAEALEVCRALIDQIKAQVPIWKRQLLADGTTEWVGSC